MKPPEYGYRITDHDRSLLPNRLVADLEADVSDRDGW